MVVPRERRAADALPAVAARDEPLRDGRHRAPVGPCARGVDLEHRLIFDLAVFAPLVVTLAAVGIFDRGRLLGLLLAAALSGLIFLLFYGLGWLLYRQEALGFGDVKLALLIGALVGWPGLVTALFATTIIAAVLSLLLLASGAAERRTYIPFGVFMALGAAIALFSAPLPW